MIAVVIAAATFVVAAVVLCAGALVCYRIGFRLRNGYWL